MLWIGYASLHDGSGGGGRVEVSMVHANAIALHDRRVAL
jgi:hypothetical protein